MLGWSEERPFPILIRISFHTRTTQHKDGEEADVKPPSRRQTFGDQAGEFLHNRVADPKGFAEIQQGRSDGALRHADAVIFHMEPDRLSVALESTRYFHNAFGARRLLKLMDE